MFSIFKKKKVEENKVEQPKVEQPVEPKKEPKKLVEIEDFDQTGYTKEVFKTLFHSLRTDDWKKDVASYREMRFTKKIESPTPKSRFEASSAVEITVEYGFDISSRLFTIKELKVRTPNGSTLSYPKTQLKYDQIVVLDDETISFFYEVYADWKNKENSQKKEKIDESIKSIKSVVGLSTVRDSKIDELLG